MSSEFGDFSPFRARSAVKPGLESAFRRRAGIGGGPAGRRRSRPGGGRRDPWARIDHHDNVAFGELILRRFRVSATWAYVERLPGSPARTARNGSPRNCHGHRFAPTIPAFPANPGSTAKSPAGSTKRRAGENAGQKPFQTYQAHSRTLTLHAKRPPRHRPARRKSKTARRDRRAVRHMLLRLSLTPGRRPYAARRPCRCAPT